MYKVYVIDKPIYSDDEYFFQPSQACNSMNQNHCVYVTKIENLKKEIKKYFKN